MSLWPYIRPGDAGTERLHERFARTLDSHAVRGEIRAAIATGELDPAVPFDRLVARSPAIKKDRFIVLVDAADDRGRRLELVAKGYWDDERASRVLANHRRLWQTGLGEPGAAIRTSRPFGMIAPLGVVLSERLPGKHPLPGDLEAAERVGRAAALLHSCPVELEPSLQLDVALANVERHARLLERQDAPAGARARGLAERAWALGPDFAYTPRSALNGDLSLGSVLLDGGRTYLIDWDIACSFDPAWDVGHYVLQLFRVARERGEQPDAPRRSFLAAYRSRVLVDGSFDERVSFYEALAAIHKAYTVVRVGGREAVGLANELLDVAAARLAERS